MTRNSVARLLLASAAVWAAACGGGPAGTGVTPAMSGAVLTVTMSVANGTFGTAVTADFTLGLKNSTGIVTTWPADEDGTAVMVPPNDHYQIIVVHGPDGYEVSRSIGCSGTAAMNTSLGGCSMKVTEQAFTCDHVYWDPMYSPDRLKVLSQCEVASGRIVWIEPEYDGDVVFHIVPDQPYQPLLRPGNADLGGTLVVEVPCQGAVTQADAMHACDNYKGPHITVPPVGTHIVAAAHHVQDRNHGMWAELHGANLRVLPR